MATNFSFESRSLWRDSAWDVPICRTPLPSCLEQIDEQTSIYAGRPQDHAAVLALLEQTSGKRRTLDFSSRIDEPGYHSTDRLLMRRAKSLIGHVHVSHRVAWFGKVRVPVAILADLALLPEFEQGNYSDALLEVAEDQARREGAVVAVAFTSQPALLARRGYRAAPGQGRTLASTRATLAHLETERALRASRAFWHAAPPALDVSVWRQYRLEEVRALYDQQFADGQGALCRSEETWHWLMSRSAHDLVLVAHDRSRCSGGDQPEQVMEKIHGYAVLRDSCIVELAAEESPSQVRSLLLAAACREALDRDHRHVALHAPASDSLHELLVVAGGSWAPMDAAAGGCWMVKLLAPEKWVHRMFDRWHERAREIGLVRPFQFDLIGDDEPRRFSLTRRSASLQRSAQPGARWIKGPMGVVQDLLMGSLACRSGSAMGEVRVSDASLLDEWRMLTPPQAFWQSPWELLRVC